MIPNTITNVKTVVAAAYILLIACGRGDMVVNWNIGCVQLNVGDVRMNVENKIRETGNPDRVSQQAEDIIGKLFPVPQGLPPTSSNSPTKSAH